MLTENQHNANTTSNTISGLITVLKEITGNYRIVLMQRTEFALLKPAVHGNSISIYW